MLWNYLPEFEVMSPKEKAAWIVKKSNDLGCCIELKVYLDGKSYWRV